MIDFTDEEAEVPGCYFRKVDKKKNAFWSCQNYYNNNLNLIFALTTYYYRENKAEWK